MSARVPYIAPPPPRGSKSAKYTDRINKTIRHVRACELDRAETLATAVRDEAMRDADNETAGRALSLLGEVASMRGDLATASRKYGGAIELLESTELAGSISRAYRGLAYGYLTFDLPQLAVQPALDARRVAELSEVRATRERAVFECAICEGNVALDLGRIADAESRWSSVGELVEPLAAIDAWLPGLYHLLGANIAIARGRRDGDDDAVLEGTTALEQVAGHFRAAGLPYWEARAHDALGRALEPDDHAAAVSHLREARGMYRRIGAARLLDSCEQALARVRPQSVNRYRDTPAKRSSVRLAPDAQLVEGLFIAGPKTREMVELAIRYANRPNPVLITGESGTGKERIARMIHAHSDRAKGPFVAVNCTTLQPTLVESILFGHKRGSFTGATTNRAGMVSDAAGGTLFLDEIGDLPLDIQPKLLRFLESGRVLVLGDSVERPVDVRIIAATNRNLDEAVRAGTFREDLFYRINVLKLQMVPLRDRVEEVPRLAEYLAKSSRISMAGLNVLAGYPWPGNVRQLNNVVVRAVADAGGTGSLVDREHIDGSLRSEPATPMPDASTDSTPAAPDFPFMLADGSLPPGMALHDAENEFQRFHIAKAIAKHNGNKTRAAEELGMKLQTMLVRAQKLGLR